MDVGTRVGSFRKEHHDFLRLLDDGDLAVERTADKDERESLRGLNRLRELQPQREALHARCTSEERNVEGPYCAYPEKGQIDTLRAEHEQLACPLVDLFTELRFDTTYQTEHARRAGRQVATFARRHILFEEKLLEWSVFVAAAKVSP